MEAPLPINDGMKLLPLGRPCPIGVQMFSFEESLQYSPPEHLYSVEEASTGRASRRTAADRTEVAKANEVMMKKNWCCIKKSEKRVDIDCSEEMTTVSLYTLVSFSTLSIFSTFSVKSFDLYFLALSKISRSGFFFDKKYNRQSLTNLPRTK